MREFVALFVELDASTSTGRKVSGLVQHFARVEGADAAWAAYLLAGGKPRQAVPTTVLRQAACETAGVDAWLFEECYQVVGDLAETIAHVLPHGALGGPAEQGAGPDPERGLAHWMEQGVLPLRGLPPDEQVRRLRQMWSHLDGMGRFLLTKLVGGGFRVGVSRLLVQRAVAEHAGLEAAHVAQRMMGWTQATHRPDADSWRRLVAPPEPPSVGVAREDGQPYPFFLAQAVDPADEPRMDEVLGPVSDWMVEWKYDGIRAQVVRRGPGVWIWSRGEELLDGRFPEVEKAARALPPGTVIDGELLVMRQGRPAPFAELQTRITRKTVTRGLLERTPVGFMAYDLMEVDGQDVREWPQHERRARLQQVVQALRGEGGVLDLSPLVSGGDWAALQALRQDSRSRGVEGFMLKHRLSRYGIGRRKVEPGTGLGGGSGVGFGTGWWKWKVQPMTVDAVLVYAQAGHGRRASLYTDYTFAVWSRTPRDEEEVQAVLQAIGRREPPPNDPEGLRLVPFAKAYSGLSDEEFARVDRVIRSTTVEKFGPVRSVVPSLVFELGFEGMARSTRHKSGVAVRFPRMLRWRTDKPLREADTMESLFRLGSIAD